MTFAVFAIKKSPQTDKWYLWQQNLTYRIFPSFLPGLPGTQMQFSVLLWNENNLKSFPFIFCKIWVLPYLLLHSKHPHLLFTIFPRTKISLRLFRARSYLLLGRLHTNYMFCFVFVLVSDFSSEILLSIKKNKLKLQNLHLDLDNMKPVSETWDFCQIYHEEGINSWNSDLALDLAKFWKG